MPIQSWNVKCSACPRTFEMTLNTLGQRKTCTFCGEPLVIPPEMKQAASDALAVKSAPRTSAIDCPLCLRRISLQNPVAGHTYSCSYCTCRYVLDASFHPSPETLPLPFPEPVEQSVARIRCGSCKLLKLKADPAAPARAACTACGTEQILFTHPLDSLLELPPSSSPLVESACAAVLARWERRDIGLAEAWWIFEELGAVDRALNSQNSLLQQLSPLIASEVVQFCIFGAPSAEVIRNESGVTLIMPQTAAKGSTTDVNVSRTLAMNVVGMGLLLTTGRGFIGVSRNKSEGRQADPALLLHFLYTQSGCELRASVRDTDGNISPVAAKELQKIESEIASALPDAVRRLYVVKAIFGNWITGAMLYGMPATALKTRLESLGGSLALRADALAAALTQMPR